MTTEDPRHTRNDTETIVALQTPCVLLPATRATRHSIMSSSSCSVNAGCVDRKAPSKLDCGFSTIYTSGTAQSLLDRSVSGGCPVSVGSKSTRSLDPLCQMLLQVCWQLRLQLTNEQATKQQSNSQTLLRLRDGTISIARLILRFPLLRRYVLILANKSNYTQSSRSNKHINYIWSYYQSITGLVALNNHVESYIILFVPGLCCMPCLCLTI